MSMMWCDNCGNLIDTDYEAGMWDYIDLEGDHKDFTCDLCSEDYIENLETEE